MNFLWEYKIWKNNLESAWLPIYPALSIYNIPSQIITHFLNTVILTNTQQDNHSLRYKISWPCHLASEFTFNECVENPRINILQSDNAFHCVHRRRVCVVESYGPLTLTLLGYGWPLVGAMDGLPLNGESAFLWIENCCWLEGHWEVSVLGGLCVNTTHESAGSRGDGSVWYQMWD